MHFRQDFEDFLKRSRAIAKYILKFLVNCLEWVVTSVVAVVLGVAIGVARASKALYQSRAKIVGLALLVGTIVLMLSALNQTIGYGDSTNGLHMWFVRDYHWAVVLGVVSFALAATWSFVAPTLRTLFGKNWTRILVWGLSGVLLAAIAYADLLQEDIAYRNIYVSAVILYIVTLAIIAKLLSPKSIPASDSPYIDDSPAGHHGAEPYETQRRIVADIKRLIEGGRPSTVAITGHWGIGKTFLLLRAQHELEYDDSIIWMNFEPWRYASEEALIRGFYQDIGTTLTEKIPGMQHITKPLAETTDKFVRQHDGTGIFGAAVDALRASTSNDNPENQIKDLLDQEGRRLVIVIDDVERSFNPEQIFRTLQLAHFAKNIHNVQVVFLYEKDVVLKACPAHLVGSSQTEYLEKFVEVEVFVPSPRPAELRQLFTSFMSIHRNRAGFDFTEDDLPDEMLYAVNTPRLVKLLANEFVAFRLNLEEGQNESR